MSAEQLPLRLREAVIHTTAAQWVYETSYDNCAASMRGMGEVVPIFARKEDDMMVVHIVVDRILSIALTELRAESVRIAKVASDNGFKIERLVYAKPMRYQARLTCTRAPVYLEMISALDEFIRLVHSTWLAGLIEEEEKDLLEDKWRKKVNGVCSQIQNISERTITPALLAAFCAEHRRRTHPVDPPSLAGPPRLP